jgi:hypothetical protein
VIDEHIEEGIENAVPAFLRLFSGTHDGKLILRIAAGARLQPLDEDRIGHAASR